ncbi:TPA: hypothetical protein DD455_03685 [Candidatus Shapirobacteria bacterium]|nr:hypothetical protein [Candidatus Shapirobacteria bacterium]
MTTANFTRKNGWIFLITSFIFLRLISTNAVQAAISSCSVSVDPTSTEASMTTDFTFSLTNNDAGNNGMWFKITKPHSNVNIIGYMMYPTWFRDISSDSYTFRYDQTPISPGATINPHITLEIGDFSGITGNWVVQMSDSVDGTSPTTCSGNTSFSVSETADHTPPSILSINISNITFNEAVISWTTDEASTSLVKYDVNAQQGLYPFSKSESSLVTSHSLTLTNLGASTIYYFSVCSTDAFGNEVCANENSFTTQEYQATATLAPVRVEVTINTTTTSNSTPTPTPTPKPLVDRVRPTVRISTDFSKPYLIAPTIEGKAFDGGDINVGVAGIEYSLDGGKNWLPVDNLEGKGKKSASFEFTPVGLDDGNYLIKMRAKDSTGNVGQSKVYTMVVDRLPPQVGGVLYSLGPMILKPDENGRVFGIAGLQVKVTLGAVGGPVTMDLFYNSEKFSLIKNIESGLWSGIINLITEGSYKLMVKSIDGAKNETERALNSIVSLRPGRVVDDKGKGIKGARVKVYVFEKIEGDYVLWDGRPYGQENPQKTNKNGEYKLFLPAGKYFVEVEMTGKKKQRTEIFEIEKPTPITNNFGLNKIKGFWNFWAEMVPIKLDNNRVNIGKEEKIKLVGKNLPSFDLSVGEDIFSDVSILGRPTVLTFVSTWEPQTADQLNEIEKLAKNNSGINVVAVTVQESVSKTNIYKKVGGYDVKIMADPDGILVEPLGLESLPRHIFVDRKGVIKESSLGFMTEKDMWQKVLE